MQITNILNSLDKTAEVVTAINKAFKITLHILKCLEFFGDKLSTGMVLTETLIQVNSFF